MIFALSPEVEALLDALDGEAPLAPLVRRLLAIWRAADRVWAELAPLGEGDAAADAARRSALVTQWACRQLFGVLHRRIHDVPWHVRLGALREGLLSLDDEIDAASAEVEAAHRGDDRPSGLWSALMVAAERDGTALDRVIAAMDASISAGDLDERTAIERLAELGRHDEAAARLPRVRWPSDRARAVAAAAPGLDAARRAAAIDEAWEAVLAVSWPELPYRLEPLAGLVALEGEPSERARRARALAALVETLPEAELEACPDHADLREIVASAHAVAGAIDEALSWTHRLLGSPWAARDIADVARRLPEPHRTALALDTLARLPDAPDDETLVSLAAVSPAVAEACAARISSDGWEGALARLALAVHLPASAPDAVAALGSLPVPEGADEGEDVSVDALTAIAAVAAHAPAEAERVSMRFTALALDGAPDVYDLAAIARCAPGAMLGAVLDAIARAVRTAAPDDYRDRSALRRAMVELYDRPELAHSPDLARANALLAELCSAADTANDPDPEFLALLPPEVRRALLSRALRHLSRRAVSPVSEQLWLDALDPDSWGARDLSSPERLAEAARALARGPEQLAAVEAALAASPSARRALVIASERHSFAALLAGLARGEGMRLPPDWREEIARLPDEAALAGWLARQPAPVRERAAPAAPRSARTAEDLERLEAELGPPRRDSSLDGEVWAIVRGWCALGEAERARALLPRFGWEHYRKLCTVELECAVGDEIRAERALAAVLEPPEFYTTPSDVARHAAELPGPMYRVAQRAPSPGLREELIANLLDCGRDPAPWSRAGLDRERVRAELDASIAAALAAGAVPPGIVPLSFAHLSPSTRHRAWGWAFGAEGRAQDRFRVFPPVDRLASACAVAGVEVAPVLAAIESRLCAQRP